MADRRCPGTWSLGRRPGRRRVGGVGLLCGAPRAGGSVLQGAGTPTLESASQPPLTFAILDPANRLTAGDAAEASRLAPRLGGRFIATRPVAQGSRQQNVCCVTTRRRNFDWTGSWRRRSGTLPARTLRLGVPGFDRFVQASLGLPPGRLPAADLAQAFGVLAVALVPSPRLVLPCAAFAQAQPRAWSSRSCTARALRFNVEGAHGSYFSQGTARGERITVLPGRLFKSKTDRRLPVYPRQNEEDKEGNSLRKARKKETMKYPPTVLGWRSSNAQNRQ